MGLEKAVVLVDSRQVWAWRRLWCWLIQGKCGPGEGVSNGGPSGTGGLVKVTVLMVDQLR